MNCTGSMATGSMGSTRCHRQVTCPLGEDALGQLSYHGSGRMSAQLMRQHQACFASEDWQQASEKEKAAAWGNYFGYFGTYTIDENAETVTHHIEGSWFPNLIGTQQVRHYHFQRNQLVLNAATPWGQVQIVWEKVKQQRQTQGGGNTGKVLL
jgi:hypothetical protein